MRPFHRTAFSCCVASLGLLGFAIDASADDKPGAEAPAGYASPQEAFEALRDAIAKHDWQKAFASLTPEVQELEYFIIAGIWIMVEEGMEDALFSRVPDAERDEVRGRFLASMKKCGLDYRKLWVEYDKRYLAKHGVDLAKIKAELRRRARERTERYFKEHPEERAEVDKHLKDHPEDADKILLPPEPGEDPGPSLPKVDDEIVAKVLYTLATDKVGCYGAGQELSIVIKKPRTKRKPAYEQAPEILKGLTVTGDTAKGWLVRTPSSMEGGTRELWDPVRVLRKFRRLDGRWYNDYRYEDETRPDEDEERAKASRLQPGGKPGEAERKRP